MKKSEPVKKQNRVTTVAKKRRKTKKPTSQHSIVRVFFGVLVLLITLRVGFFSTSPKIHQSSVLSVQNAVVSPTLVPTVPITPSVTLQPQNIGYCIIAPSILYHHIEPLNEAQKEGHAQLTVDSSIFDQHLAYLSEHGYHAISADDLVNALLNHTALPEKSVVITLDDGYSDAYTYAFPAAKKYHMIINLMIPTGLLENSGYMTWNQLKEMVDSGIVYAYNHTWSHYSLPAGDDTKIHSEISTAKKELEEHLGKSAGKIFTYPYGSFDNRTIDILKQEGYTAAFSTIPSFTQCDSSLFAIRRNHVANAPLSTYGF